MNRCSHECLSHNFYEITDYGTYYFPAWKHYHHGANVVCDKCHKDYLDACIGHRNRDLCLTCAEQLTRYRSSRVCSGLPCDCVGRRHSHILTRNPTDRTGSIADVCDEVRLINK